MKLTILFRIMLVVLTLLVFNLPKSEGGIPCTHVLICCRENNKGIKFLVNGKWNPAHDYNNISQVSDLLQKIKDAGINIVIIDMTNDSQWNQYWDIYRPMVNNIQKVCKQKNMQFIIFIGAAGSFSDWNEKAKRIWNLWAQDESYRKYGFGDNRPMLVAFQPSDMYWERYDKAPDSAKTYLSKFHIGTTQVNDPILPGKSDGWGYRNFSQSVDGKVRFVCPDGGVTPDAWYHIKGNEWKRRVNWAKQAEEYSVYGSYDDTCDGINWGIADTKNTAVKHNKYPGGDPYLYYSILQEALTKSSKKQVVSKPPLTQQNAATKQYDLLKAKLAVGWNTWNTRSVLSHVLLPQSLAINLELEDGSTNKILREALIGRRGEGVETISPGLHSFDGSYTELTLKWQTIKVKIESAGAGNNLVILVTPLNKSSANELLIQPALLWGKNGVVNKTKNGFNISLPTGDLPVYISNKTYNAHFKDSLLATSALTKEIGISVGEKKSVAQIDQILAEARRKLISTYTKYKEDAELYKAMQNVLSWDVIYEPTHDRVIAPVSRIWSVDAKGWVIFDWDTYFASYMFAAGDKNLAYANAIAITDEITGQGFIPNYAAGLGKTNDRSQPPVGSMMIREVYRKYKEKWLLDYTFDNLLQWNRWWPQKRDVKGYLVWGSDLLNPQAPKWESGLDNSTMYDGAPYDSISQLQNLADVGLMSLYIEDCKALADIARELNKPVIVEELNQRAAKYTASLKTLWNNEFGLFLNKRLDNNQFSYRLSPTLFYPLIAGVATQTQAERMIKEHFYNPKEFWGNWIMPSSARNDTAYKDNTYWRGRIWAPMNFLVYLGFRNYNLSKAKRDLVDKSKKLLLKSWLSKKYIYENYNAETGEGDDVANSDKFYHWGALLGFISLIEDGYVLPPLHPLNK